MDCPINQPYCIQHVDAWTTKMDYPCMDCPMDYPMDYPKFIILFDYPWAIDRVSMYFVISVLMFQRISNSIQDQFDGILWNLADIALMGDLNATHMGSKLGGSDTIERHHVKSRARKAARPGQAL